MSWTRGGLAALAACVLLLAGPTGCGSGEAHGRNEPDGASPSPVGRLLDRTDEEGRHYREVAAKGAPEVRVEVEPDAEDSWDVRLAVRNFRFSPTGTPARAVAGRGLAYLYVDGAPVDVLRGPAHRLPAGLVPRGTHHVTARLYADDGTVWAVHGRPIESTADITESPAVGLTGPAVSPAAGLGRLCGCPAAGTSWLIAQFPAPL
ncbi:hypothetical protein [Streptomyces mangrovisoli]|uniref:Nuclear transport factor 2 family protein n=1 Tax=Streptomyces mangrovisoli TaxID=1428628 RepID=A0A1J4NYH2_9ACTN|nr:hypothetical protein [Streptomyces mangrovisoli]OIJ66285.1 hypothetical protein WN71_018950 [Streptomyces mangrovisoli]